MAFTIFTCPLFTFSKKWNTEILAYLVIELLGQAVKLKRTWNLSPVNQLFKKLLKIILLAYIYQLAKFGDFMIFGSKDIFKNASCLHRDITDLVNHGMVKNTKTWISWERNIIFLRNKKILNLCFRWHILRSCRFVVEVTFKWG